MWQDFDWKERTVTIERDIDYSTAAGGIVGDLKTKSSYRIVPIPNKLYDMLTPIRGLPGVFLFCGAGNKHISRTTYQRWFMSLMIDAGFAEPVEREEGDKKKGDIRFDWSCDITAHYFRHHYATMLYNAGIDPLTAMKLLGHSSYQTTAMIYTHLNESHIAEAKVKLNAMHDVEKVAEKLPVAANEGQNSDKSTNKKPPKS